MDMYILQNFLVLAKTLNFTKAAEELHIVQPALSKQIQNLENRLGFILFHRTNRNVSLSTAGQYFKQEAERLVLDYQQVVQKGLSIEQGTAGTLHLAHSSTSMHRYLPHLLASFKIHSPDLSIILTEASNKIIVDLLKTREADVGFCPNVQIPDGFKSHTLYQENFVLISPDNVKINLSDIKTLKDQYFILPPRNVAMGYVDSVYKVFDALGFEPKIYFESANTNTVLRMVEAGLGLSIEPQSSLLGYNLKLQVHTIPGAAGVASTQLIYLKERQNELQTKIDFMLNAVE